MLGAIFMLTTREPQRLKLPNVIFGTFVSLVLCNLIYRVTWFLWGLKRRFSCKPRLSSVNLMSFKKMVIYMNFINPSRETRKMVSLFNFGLEKFIFHDLILLKAFPTLEFSFVEWLNQLNLCNNSFRFYLEINYSTEN